MRILSQILFCNSSFTIVQSLAAQLEMSIIQYDLIRLSVNSKHKINLTPKNYKNI